jgi:hypothetical protein
VRELLAVVAIDAVVGGDPQEAVAVLDDAGDEQVAQAVGSAERAEPDLAARDLVGARGWCEQRRRVVRGLAHITGGGLVDNIPRILPPGCRVFLKRTWPVPPVFGWLQRLGNIDQDEMDRVFNGGIGFVVIASPYFAESIQRQLQEDRVPTWVIGEVREGEAGVEWEV